MDKSVSTWFRTEIHMLLSLLFGSHTCMPGTSAMIVNDWITQSVSSIFELLGKGLHSGALSIQRLQGAESMIQGFAGESLDV